MTKLSPKITPAMLSKGGTEDGLQSAYFFALNNWLKSQLGEGDDPNLRLLDPYWVFAVPNGGARDAITAGVMKATGVRSGVADICIPFARCGYCRAWIEFKLPKHRNTKNGGMSDNQLLFATAQHNDGALFRVFYDWETAIQFTIDYFSNALPAKPLP